MTWAVCNPTKPATPTVHETAAQAIAEADRLGFVVHAGDIRWFRDGYTVREFKAEGEKRC